MAKKKQDMNPLEISQRLETYSNEGVIKYVISRTPIGEYYFLIPEGDTFKLVASSHSGAFEKERKKWAK